MRWNLNIHYHRAVLDAIPDGATTALDVGSGDGLLTFDLVARGLEIVGIDTDLASVERARGLSMFVPNNVPSRRRIHPPVRARLLRPRGRQRNAPPRGRPGIAPPHG